MLKFRHCFLIFLILSICLSQKLVSNPLPTTSPRKSPSRNSLRNLFLKVSSKLSLKSPLPKNKARKNLLYLAKNALNKTLSRHLMIDKLMDKVMVPRHDLHPLIMPMSIPQISDARITVQNFNPPPLPLVAGMLPKDEKTYKITIPENHEHDNSGVHHQKNLNLFLPGKFNNEVKQIVDEAFTEAFKKYVANHPGAVLPDNRFKMNVFDTPTERELSKEETSRRIDSVFGRIERLTAEYCRFKGDVEVKVKKLGFLLNDQRRIKLNYIVD